MDDIRVALAQIICTLEFLKPLLLETMPEENLPWL